MSDRSLRKHLISALQGGDAHNPLDASIRDFPASLAGARVGENPHTPWRLLEHMRIAQWDILEYCWNPDHVSPQFPDGYWPSSDTPPSSRAWKESVDAFCSDLAAMRGLVEDPESDLFTPIRHGEKQTLLHEAMNLAIHNAYHLGQLMFIRRGVATESVV
ncbi:MAG: DinB family protein [Candidatus Hydrogenedentes bacterium]|nr:DinB family protein [Candidatus Hydrogenedentota bacterium]